MIETLNISKSFNHQQVLAPTSLTFEAGKIYGLIGRNGSGKTVLLKLLAGLLYPTSGKIVIDHQTLHQDMAIPPSMGLIIEKPGFIEWKSGLDNLKLLASLKKEIDLPQIMDILEKVELSHASKRRVKHYSLGMKQRLSIAQALMENPRILILDEPMNGLDNSGVELVRQLLLTEKANGKLIILASHYIEDINLLCDHVFQIDQGHVTQVQ